MAKKILIIGNGFDIDLGLRTRYSDFANSKIWEQLMENTYGLDQDLLGALKKAKEKEAWFDIEKTMNDYVREIVKEYVESSDEWQAYIQELKRKDGMRLLRSLLKNENISRFPSSRL